MENKMTRGQWWAAFFAARFASWYFLLGALVTLNVWVILNSFGIIAYDRDWGKADLVLSEVTYLVDIIIIMNQLCQAALDRSQMNRLMALEEKILAMETSILEAIQNEKTL